MVLFDCEGEKAQGPGDYIHWKCYMKIGSARKVTFGVSLVILCDRVCEYMHKFDICMSDSKKGSCNLNERFSVI